MCSASRSLCPLPGHIQPVQEEQAASFFVWMCFHLSSRYYNLICTLKTKAVGQDPLVPVLSVAIALQVFPQPREREPVCLLQRETPGLLSAITARCRTPKTLNLYRLHCSLYAYNSQR